MRIAYDGSDFHGWSATQNSVKSTLQIVLEQILQHPVRIEGASRTDSGVHAEGQVATFRTEKEVIPRRLLLGVNALLPPSIRLLEIINVPEQFHPTLHALSKEYHYYVCNTPFQKPQWRYTSWHLPYPLDLNAMRAAAAYCVGEKDFAAFANQKQHERYATTVRTLLTCDLHIVSEERLRFSLSGNAFLYKMVRNLVGALIAVGRGKLSLQDLEEIFTSCNRSKNQVTAPAHGLFLHEIIYGPTQ